MGKRRKSSRSIFLSFLSLACLTATAVFAASPDQRAREIIGQMTLDEKIAQLHGIGSWKHYRQVPPLPRLGIGAMLVTNGPAGVGPGDTEPQPKATAMPAPILLAATWDAALARQYGEIIGGEARDLGNTLLEAPTVNIARVPQSGRVFEGYGEDPFLAGRLAAASVEGIQSQGEIANVKHFAVNEQETDRYTLNEAIDERTLREIYLPAFEMAVRQGHAASVMCSYPKINGTYNCDSDLLLNQILKKEWGFEGFVTSDFNAVKSTIASALAGLDLEMPNGRYWGDDRWWAWGRDDLKTAVTAGQVPMETIDDKLFRRFRTMIRFGMLDGPPAPKPIPGDKDGAEARAIAEQGIVLLKNQGGQLPLQASLIKSIALIGPFAAAAVTGGGGSAEVRPLYTISPEAGLRLAAGAAATISVSDGSDTDEAAALARTANVAIVMVGQVDEEGRDHSLALPDHQDDLVRAVAAANPHTVVVLKTGSAVLMPWAADVPAILEAWYPGEEDGNAVAAVLFGKVNPSGKLPLTFPARLEDLPASTPPQYPGRGGIAHYSEGVMVGYRFYDMHRIAPLFPFGHGLSYTTFSYSRLKTSPAQAAAGKLSAVAVEFDVANSGTAAGAETAQLYLGLPGKKCVPQPPKQLKGFEKIALAPGQTKHIRLTLDRRAFSWWDAANHDWKIMPGPFRIMVGSSSRDIRLEGSVKVD